MKLAADPALYEEEDGVVLVVDDDMDAAEEKMDFETAPALLEVLMELLNWDSTRTSAG